MSHGQAPVELGFNINKSLVKVNMKEETIVAKKIICDYMLANSLKPCTVEISNKLILSCSTAPSKIPSTYWRNQKGNRKQSKRVWETVIDLWD